MHSQPETAALLGAVAAFLREVCAPALTGREAFLAKVAANCVDIAVREACDGPAATAAETTILQSLLASPETSLEALRATLCNEIIAGVRDETDPALLEALLSIVAARVRIEQPGYASLERAPRA